MCRRLVAATILVAACAVVPVLQAAPPSRPVTIIQGAEPEGLDASMTTGVLSLNPALISSSRWWTSTST